MTGVKVMSRAGRAVALNASEVKGNLFLDEGFLAEGDVDLINSSIGLTLNLTSCDIRPNRSPSLRGDGSEDRRRGTVFADHCEIGGSVFMNDDSRVSGSLHLVGASIRVGFI